MAILHIFHLQKMMQQIVCNEFFNSIHEKGLPLGAPFGYKRACVMSEIVKNNNRLY